MPSHSPAQARMMAAAAHDPKFAKKVGVPVSVAKDYNEADKGKRLAEAMKAMAKKKNEGG
jgi:ribosome assembly protein YihI (activator of Der GTPase)